MPPMPLYLLSSAKNGSCASCTTKVIERCYAANAKAAVANRIIPAWTGKLLMYRYGWLP